MTFDDTIYVDLINDLRQEYEENKSTSIVIEAAHHIESLLEVIRQLQQNKKFVPAIQLQGMTLRQYYAGQAIIAMPQILPLMNIFEIGNEEVFAKFCCVIANEMVAHLEEK